MQLLKMKDVMKITGLTRQTIKFMEQDGDFPKSGKISERGTRWREEDVRAWIDDKME